MFEKYKNINDNELVLLYKNNHNDDVEYELIARYQRHSKKLAKELFDKFSFLYQVEFDDLYCILLGALFSAIRSFKDASSNFYTYWKTISTNEVSTYVSKFPNIQKGNVVNYINYEQGINQSGYFKERPEEFEDDYLTNFELEEILTNPKNKFASDEVDIFRLYLAGYSISDIASLTHKSYYQIRYKIENVRREIVNILFNQ